MDPGFRNVDRSSMSLDYKVADLSLAEFGRNEIRLAEHEMPGLMRCARSMANQSHSPERVSRAHCT